MKGILVSLDMIIALPIASATILLLISSYHSNVSQLSGLAANETAQLNLYDKSQILVGTLNKLHLNYSESTLLINNYSTFNLLNSTIENFDTVNSTTCIGIVVCRIVQINGNSYLLVIKNESPN